MSDKKQCIGTCVGNPFETIEELSAIIDSAREITKNTFLKHCEIEEDIKASMKRFPYDYSYYKNKDIYFFTWSMIEHFYK